LKEKEVVPFLQEIDTQGVEVGIYPSYGSLVLTFSSDRPVGFWIDKIAQRFPSYFLKEGTIQQAIYKEMVEKKKTLGLVESCTGGAIAARLVTVPGASSFFLGSIVAYSNDWKEKFLGLKRDTLLHTGAVSLRTVKEMIEAIFLETNVDYAIAVSGIAGPSGGTQEKKTGTIYIAVGKRGEKIDAGRIIGPQNRLGSIELSVQTALGALWRRIASNAFTLS